MAEPVEVAYEVDGQGPWAVFVHGVGGRRQAWREVVAQLRAEFRCVTFDVRGHGESPGRGTFGLEELVADIEALRARLGIELFHLVGYSLGGVVAPAYVRAHPARVASVALLSTAAFRTEEDRARARLVVDKVAAEGIAAVLPTLEARWFTDRFIAAHPDRVAARKRDAAETDRSVYESAFRVYAETETSPWLPAIRVPALVLTGELDPSCSPRLNRQMADAIPGAKLVVLEGLKHGLLVEAPDLVAAHLRDFLRAAAGPGGAASR